MGISNYRHDIVQHAIMKGGPELSQGVREIVLALYAKIEQFKGGLFGFQKLR